MLGLPCLAVLPLCALALALLQLVGHLSSVQPEDTVLTETLSLMCCPLLPDPGSFLPVLPLPSAYPNGAVLSRGCVCGQQARSEVRTLASPQHPLILTGKQLSEPSLLSEGRFPPCPFAQPQKVMFHQTEEQIKRTKVLAADQEGPRGSAPSHSQSPIPASHDSPLVESGLGPLLCTRHCLTP